MDNTLYLKTMEVKRINDDFCFWDGVSWHKFYTDGIHDANRLHAWLTDQLGLGWVSVSDRLPDDTRIYLVAIAWYKHAWTASCVFGKWIGEGGKPLLGITHWRPLPTPPEGE